MKNQFEFFGIQTPKRRKVCKDYMKQHKLKDDKELEKIVQELCEFPEREFQYFAIELLSFYKKLWQLPIIKLFENCIMDKSWWDTVDFIATACSGPYFKIFAKQIAPITGQ